jgi:SAM-dependent methyltransferase
LPALLIVNIDQYLTSIGLSEFIGRTILPHCDLCDGEKFNSVADYVLDRAGQQISFSVSRCMCCGLLIQLPRFEPSFYEAYYAHHYRAQTWGDRTPSCSYIEDQVRRGELLLASLSNDLPPIGKILDVGCASGGMLKAFNDTGWHVIGYDPDEVAVATGRHVFDFDLRIGKAESMVLHDCEFNLITIMGSLEHVIDPRSVLTACRRAILPQGRILIEGHGLGQARLAGGFGQNHRRYLDARSLLGLLQKTGWQPIWFSEDELCGPTRPGSVFCLAAPTYTETL